MRYGAAMLLLLLVCVVCAWPGAAVSAQAVPAQAVAMEGTAVSTGIPLALPVRRDESPAWQTGGVGIFGALAVVMLALGLVVWLLWRSGWARGDGNTPSGARHAARSISGGGWRGLMAVRATAQLRVVESARLTPRSSVHVVQWNGQQWLLGCAEQGITVIGHQPGRPASAQAAADDGAGHAKT